MLLKPRLSLAMADGMLEAESEEDVVSLARQKKKIRVNAATLVDLKAALYRKQQEFKREKGNQAGSDSTLPVTRKISDKTAAIWRRPVKGQTGAGSRVKGKKEATALKQKTAQHLPEMTAEEEATLAKSRAALEAKAALYDKLHHGEGLRDSDDEEDEELGPRYMVDFHRKLYEEVSLRQQKEKEQQKQAEKEEEAREQKEKEETKKERKQPVSSEEEWVEYTDSFGRSRQCMRKDLPHMMKLDNDLKHVHPPPPSGGRSGSRSPSPDLLSEDMRRERVRWEKEAMEELEPEESSGPVHYQTVQHGEIRTHGVGYYGFSSEEEKRQEQLKMLNQLRDETTDQRKRREKLKEKRKALMEARLAKVRQRKLKQGEGEGDGENKELMVDIAQFDFDKKTEETGASDGAGVGDLIAQEVARAREIAEEEKRAKHVRPWDKGKKMDPIRKRRKELQDERLSEFAPPSSYYTNKRDVSTTSHQPSTSSETEPLGLQGTDTDKDNSKESSFQPSQSSPLPPAPPPFPPANTMFCAPTFNPYPVFPGYPPFVLPYPPPPPPPPPPGVSTSYSHSQQQIHYPPNQ